MRAGRVARHRGRFITALSVRTVAAMKAVAVLTVATTIVPALAFALSGREIIDAAQTRHGFSTWRDRTVQATMHQYDGETLARTRNADVTEQTDPRGEHRTFLRFTSPADVQGTRFLHLSPRGERDQQWLWTPGTRRTRRLAEAERDENFFGSDLSYRDLELMVRVQQWNDEEARAMLIGEEIIDGRPCHVVGLEPRNDEFPYAGYRLWFAKDDLLLWRLDVLLEGATVIKRITPRRYERQGEHQTPVESEVANVPAGTHTMVELRDVHYNRGVDEDVFDVSSMDRK